MSSNPRNAPFGSILSDTMAIAHYRNGEWSAMELRKTGTLEIHPAAHALHYGSTCFEGFKAYRHADGSIGGYQSGHLVYGREGQPCPACGSPLRRIIQAQRSTFLCAGCQRR